MIKRFFSTLVFLLFGLLALQQTVLAQFEEGISVTNNAHILGTNITVGAADSVTYSSQGELKPKIKNVISFKINEQSTVFPASGFTAQVDLTIETWETLTGGSQTQTQTLTVTYDTATGAKYNTRSTIALNGYEKVKITVDHITISGNSGTWDPKALLDIDNEMRITRYYKLSGDAGTLTPSSLQSALDNTDALAVSWAWIDTAHNNMTQLEWAWLENDMVGFYKRNDILDTAFLFQNNSTRVDLDYGQSGFKIPLLYPDKGNLYFRVRATFRKNDGNVISGPWSAVDSFAFNGHEPDLNWQSSTSFAENGKYKTVIQYFDGSMRGRQTVTKDNETGNAIVGETIYDLQGRPNVQILPTPTIDNAIQYFTDFNRFAGQSNAQDDPARFFDLTPAALQCSAAPPLDTTYGNGRYYSANNDWLNAPHAESKSKYIPKAFGYAYTETRFMDDATERISAQGGVGPNHQIGSGHETKYFYGKPNQQELDALFATEAGDASHYSKNMVQDANGQMSVSYVDMHGRTIATALAGASPTNLVSIENNTDYPQAAGLLTNQLLTPATNIVKDNRIESVSTILAPASTAYNFTYQLDPAIFSKFGYAINQQVCFDCKYDLEISIRPEDCSNTAPIIKKYSNLQIVPADQACGTPMGFIGEGITVPTNQISFSQTLATGSWVVRKTLFVNDSMFAIRKDSALKVFLVTTQQHIYDSVLAVQTTASGCGLPSGNTSACDSCNAHLGSYGQYKTNYLNAMGNPSSFDTTIIHPQYTKDSLACADACGYSSRLSTLANLRNQMLADMMPFTGQYAFDPAGIVAGSEQEKYNIFTSSPAISGKTKPFYKNPHTEGTATSIYYTSDNSTDPALYDGDNNYLLPNIAVADFANRFQPSWANSLIYYHPEFSNLKFAEANLSSSYAWLDKVQFTESYAQAQTAGYLNPTSVDPYFAIATSPVPANKGTMDGYITVHVPGSGTTPAIWQIANSAVLCAGKPDGEKYTCMMGLSNTGLDAQITSTADKDKVWQQFKAVYLSYRNEMLVKYINSQSGILSATAISNLQAEGKQLVFGTMQDVANQSGAGNWWSIAANTNSPSDTAGLGNAVNTYINNNNLNGDKCTAQRPFWAAKLMQCEQLTSLINSNIAANKDTVDAIINSILDGVVMVCHNSQTALQPYGASTVNPAYAGSPQSFEEVVNQVFHDHGIETRGDSNYFCNPFSIDAPKPFGKNSPLFVNYSNTLDSCGCSRFATLKDEATGLGFNATTMTGMNQFLSANYHDTLTLPVWQGLQNCGSLYTDTCGGHHFLPSPCLVYAPIAFSSFVATPAFLNCGYQKPCMSCDQLAALTAEFTGLDSSFIGVPYTSDTASDAQTQRNSLWARFLNYRTGFSLGVLEYIAAKQNCSTGGGGTVYSVIGNGMDCGPGTSVDTLNVNTRLSPYFNQYLARKTIIFQDGFTSSDTDEFTTGVDSSYGNCSNTGIAGNTGSPISTGDSSNSAYAYCAFNKPLNDISRLEPADTVPCGQAKNKSLFIAQLLFTKVKDSLTANFDSLYLAKCLGVQSTEQFYATYQPKEYHYTLYYYDQAGNLVKTLPPAAVKPNYDATYLANVITQRNAAADLATSNNELLATQYRYNTLNQVIAQKTPDAGISQFWYDRLGRLAISQNAKQITGNQYSYTLYDVLGRITEVGQRPQGTAMTQIISQDTTALKNWIASNTAGSKEQITLTVYDIPYTSVAVSGTGVAGLYQQNLRNRVSYSILFDNEHQRQSLTDGTFKGGNTATYYSYDIHGNVDTLLQDYGSSTDVPNAMNSSAGGNRFKKMVYNYDLISGKVNLVAYQPGQKDQFYHHYEYDAENRLTTVFTSKDSLFWERDAKYDYYRHGPLARTELGQNQVQGIDYAYTIQGWLKGVNAQVIHYYNDGIDPNASYSLVTNVAADAVGYSLGYFKGDYSPVGGYDAQAFYNSYVSHTIMTFPDQPPSYEPGSDLFNGNISWATYAINGIDNGATAGYTYGYDQLNRLYIMNRHAYPQGTVYLEWNINTLLQDYHEQISYDPNGNIRTYFRNGAASQLSMDNLTYQYEKNASGQLVSNKLRYIHDQAADASYTTDIDNQTSNTLAQVQAENSTSIASDNYQYDGIGNLVKDTKEGISAVTWSVYGKIKTITKTDGTVINYTYDASGNRISKTVTISGVTKGTFYVRDASGNTMSVYTSGNTAINSSHLTQSEIHLYGSSRLGVYNTNLDVEGTVSSSITIFTRGNKFFEMRSIRQYKRI